ncbi:MAG: SLC13 family permease [Firmicutes bacterium]|nr:SLC13 family permease [Bacillota bacterium]
MTLEIVLTFAILLFAIILFVTEILRADLVALLVLVLLVLVGLISPEDSISGFSNPAVVTIWAVFILSAGLARTGVASRLADHLLRLGGKSESRLLTVLMSSTAVVSAFVINVGVAAMFLPVTLDIVRRTGRSASRLLLPMIYGTTIGGMIVLIGTSSNLVVVDFLRESGVRPPGLFDFAPVGIVILIVSILYMVLLGRRILPERKTPSVDNIQPGRDFRLYYDIEERLALITIPADSPISGKTLAESRFGRALGLNVLSVMRSEGDYHIPEPDLKLEARDRLLVLGRLDVIEKLSGKPVILIEAEVPETSCLYSDHIGMIELEVSEDSVFNGKTLLELDARQKMGINLLAFRRGDMIRRTNMRDIRFQAGDQLLFRGLFDQLQSLQGYNGFKNINDCKPEKYSLHERLLYLRIPEGSPMSGSTLKDTNLAPAYGISILNIIRGEQEFLMPEPEMRLEENDLLVVEGRSADIEVLRGHQTLEIERNPEVDLKDLETDSLRVVEVMLSPHTSLTGKTLRQLNFREKFGVSVLAVWRGDRAFRTNLNDMPLQFGDALLCYGTRERFEMLAKDDDFVILTLDYREKLLLNKAPLAGLIMAGVLAAALLNWLPIYVAAIAGALLMIITKCITVEEAYRAIEWKSVFLIAAMLPLGMAIQQTGAAALVAGFVLEIAGVYGPTAILAGMMALTLLLNQFIPSPVNAVVMTPIAIATAASLGLSPYPFVMGIAYAVASSFMTPVSHPINILVMSPGGYRFSDYVKNGLPLTLIVLIVSVLLLPVVFPF